MVGMPSVGNMSRGIRCTANKAPKTTAIMSTTIVSGRRSANRTKFIDLAADRFIPRVRPEDDFLVKLFDLLPDQAQHLSPLACQTVVFTRAAAALRVDLALEPS